MPVDKKKKKKIVKKKQIKQSSKQSVQQNVNIKIGDIRKKPVQKRTIKPKQSNQEPRAQEFALNRQVQHVPVFIPNQISNENKSENKIINDILKHFIEERKSDRILLNNVNKDLKEEFDSEKKSPNVPEKNNPIFSPSPIMKQFAEDFSRDENENFYSIEATPAMPPPINATPFSKDVNPARQRKIRELLGAKDIDQVRSMFPEYINMNFQEIYNDLNRRIRKGENFKKF